MAHYKVTTKLGQGGMGEVYRATDTKVDREVVFKSFWSQRANTEPRNNRQVVDCGNGACAVTAFGLESAREDHPEPIDKSDEKAVSRFARHRNPRRYRVKTSRRFQ